MGGLTKGVVAVLLFMCCCSFVIMVDRWLKYRVLRDQSRLFIGLIADPLSEGDLQRALSIALRHKKSHIASLVATGLSVFQCSPASLFDAQMLESLKRGLERCVNSMDAEMKRGLGGLATIGATAPFVGLFGTVLGIMNAFRGSGLEKASYLGAVSAGISEALVTTALGLFVAVPAVWCYNYFSTLLENFDVEMENSSLEIVTYLAGRLDRRRK
jgi:biopolymer transport protein ExbB/biopolymer transport protein TolQ